MQLKNTLAILLTSSLLAAACSKKDDAATGSQFTINKLSDFTLSQDTTVVPFDIAALNSSFHDSVSLALSGLPDGLSVSFDEHAGTAPFSTQMRFVNYYAAPGVYPLQLTAASKSGGTKTYQLRATAAPFNGVRLSGVAANMTKLITQSGYLLIETKSSNGMVNISLAVQAKDFPGKQGSFTYKLSDINKKPFESMAADEIVLQLSCTDNTGTHSFNPAFEGQEITVSASGGKYHLQCPHAVLADAKTGEERIIYMDTWNP
jgi:hypothetical protein